MEEGFGGIRHLLKLAGASGIAGYIALRVVRGLAVVWTAPKGQDPKVTQANALAAANPFSKEQMEMIEHHQYDKLASSIGTNIVNGVADTISKEIKYLAVNTPMRNSWPPAKSLSPRSKRSLQSVAEAISRARICNDQRALY